MYLLSSCQLLFKLSLPFPNCYKDSLTCWNPPEIKIVKPRSNEEEQVVPSKLLLPYNELRPISVVRKFTVLILCIVRVAAMFALLYILDMC